MNEYTLPVSDAHLKVLEARKKMLEALPKLAKPPKLPKELAFERSACDHLYSEALDYFTAAQLAYADVPPDTVTGAYCAALGNAYFSTAQVCEVATWGFFG
jgi:hypothetical protein